LAGNTWVRNHEISAQGYGGRSRDQLQTKASAGNAGVSTRHVGRQETQGSASAGAGARAAGGEKERERESERDRQTTGYEPLDLVVLGHKFQLCAQVRTPEFSIHGVRVEVHIIKRIH
jgi:hypothetical protein